MSDVVIKEVEYKNFGKCVQISNDIVKLLVTIDVGPRIINYSFLHGENILWEDVNRETLNLEVADFFGSPWYLYGGHRLWTSPEILARTYFADNSPVLYEETKNGARFIQEIQKQNKYQCEFTVTLSPKSADVKIEHKLTNYGTSDISLALWGITALSPGGLAIIPQPTKDTGLVNNRLIALWPYSRLTDSRITLGDRYITLRQDMKTDSFFKFGINSEHSFAMYFNHGDVFIKKFDAIENGIYPDGGVNLECFVNKNYLELESLGEYTKIPNGNSITHNEYWSLSKGEVPHNFDEDKFDRLVKKYV